MALLKFIISVPKTHVKYVQQALAKAGAGKIGNYDSCCFVTEGKGYFRPLEGAKPHEGTIGELAEVVECKIETVCKEDEIHDILHAAIEAHPYEEPAYDIIKLENDTYIHHRKHA